MDGAKNSTKCLRLLSQLLLGVDGKNGSGQDSAVPERGEDISRIVSRFSPQDFGELWNLANSHHVIARAFPVLRDRMAAEGHDQVEWVDHSLVKERARIQHALSFLFPICEALKEAGDVIVIKSLDH